MSREQRIITKKHMATYFKFKHSAIKLFENFFLKHLVLQIGASSL